MKSQTYTCAFKFCINFIFLACISNILQMLLFMCDWVYVLVYADRHFLDTAGAYLGQGQRVIH